MGSAPPPLKGQCLFLCFFTWNIFLSDRLRGSNKMFTARKTGLPTKLQWPILQNLKDFIAHPYSKNPTNSTRFPYET